MVYWKRNLIILWIGCFFASASYSMVIPFLPLFLTQIGVHRHLELWSGAIFSSAFLAGAISSPYWGMLADKYGRKPMIIRAGVFLSLIYILTAFVTNLYELLTLRIMQGLLTGFIPGAIALIGTNTPDKKVGYALAMISTATASGGILGPLLGGGLADLLSNRWAFASAGILILFPTILVIFCVKEVNFTPNKSKGSVLNDIKVSITNQSFMLVLFLTLITTCSLMIIEPVLPIYIAQLNVASQNTAFLTGLVYSLPGMASILFGPYFGKLADKIGFQKTLIIGLFGGGLGSILQIAFRDIVGFSIIRFVYGIFFCAVFPALNGLIVKSTSEEFRGRAFGLNQTANQLGSMIGPLLGGVMGGFFPMYSVFLMTGFLLLVAMGMMHWSKERNKANAFNK
ncbi:MFS transporter [Priestia megaterium]|uniref:MFS transporter n=3 Tax=Priestia megaterium TaxID=1404 RepID=UPI0004199D14|nr:MFS transporter [Priestia megaterium]RFB33236.1 MFS transporter [Bacillus sp. RC]MBW0933659.1 MFS transporter [Priestia megaterium]MCR8866723.1 MFS transporter [Priestia megaterium]PFJ49522.1 MFS transporter [Priestia megaterium]PFK69186.1 MFS transporter [Priestia megaterium]